MKTRFYRHLHRSNYPFQSSGSIDYASFARQMDRQLESGVDALASAEPLERARHLRFRSTSTWWTTAFLTWQGAVRSWLGLAATTPLPRSTSASTPRILGRCLAFGHPLL